MKYFRETTRPEAEEIIEVNLSIYGNDRLFVSCSKEGYTNKNYAYIMNAKELLTKFDDSQFRIIKTEENEEDSN